MFNKRELCFEFEKEARAILDFWLKYMDEGMGGFYSYSSFTGEIDTLAEKGVLLHSRILWAFSKGYNVLGDTRYLEAAKHCYRFLTGPAYDHDEGGVYWMLSYDNKVIDSQKHIYNQGFFIYALSEFYLATHDEDALKLALEVFSLCEEKSYDVVYGGYRESFDRQFNQIENKLVCDTAEGVLSEKSMNTHLHIMEAYTTLYEASKNERVLQKLTDLTLLLSYRIVDASLHFGLFFKRDWSVVSHDVSFGHDIEGTWLMDRAADKFSDPLLREKLKAKTLKMAEVTSWQGVDYDGAVMAELRDGHLLDVDRIWWVQAEAMVGFMNAYEKSHDPKFLKRSLDCFEVIKKSLIDRVNGEWFWKVDRYGRSDTQKPKVEPWKCPYHNTRACLEMFIRIQNLSDDVAACFKED